MGKLSAVIPVLNEERHIGSLLSDLATQTRPPEEVLVVDAGSIDETISVVRRYPFARLLTGEPPVACGRNLGGRSAEGEILIFLDADTRVSRSFCEDFLREFENRGLDIACPQYYPHHSTPTVHAFHRFFNLLTKTFQSLLPSGAGHCIAIRRGLFQGSPGFDPSLRFDDIELIRRLSKRGRFSIVESRVFVSDRRYREKGSLRMILRYSLMALLFALGKFRWANYIDYEFGSHEY